MEEENKSTTQQFVDWLKVHGPATHAEIKAAGWTKAWTGTTKLRLLKREVVKYRNRRGKDMTKDQARWAGRERSGYGLRARTYVREYFVAVDNYVPAPAARPRGKMDEEAAKIASCKTAIKILEGWGFKILPPPWWTRLQMKEKKK